MTPKDAGYRMPAEWERHQATWVSWPHKEASWPGKLDRVWPVFARMVAALARSETVHINVNDTAMEATARYYLNQSETNGDVRFHQFPTNDAWCRDYGAIFVTRGAAKGDGSLLQERSKGCFAQKTPIHFFHSLAGIDFGFNSWGAKYPPFDLDHRIPGRMANALEVPRFSANMILEGGSIDVNGQGVLLTTESCLLNRNRNPHLAREAIEQRLRDFLGVEQIVWLANGIAGDDTDGHVDDLARFVDPHTILTAVEDDPDDVNFAPLQENLRRLEALREGAGDAFQIITLPMPSAVYCEGKRLPATYANFYVANSVVLLPGYNDPNDCVARHILQQAFPNRKIVQLDCTDLIWGLGALHCLTQQVPDGGE